jgi:CHAT domain-containing protein
MLNNPKAFYLTSHALFNLLFNQIALAKNERLCIVADDVLGYLSFDGLITGSKYNPAISQWPFLIKRTSVTYAFSLNTLTANKASKTGTGFSGLFITHQNSKPIVAVEHEAAAISQLVNGSYIYNDEVNSTSFFMAFENSAVLHIGTHAYLSGAHSEPTLDLGKDRLYLFELLAKQQKPALVVLSACRTGDGLLAKSEGIISLARGFSAIGTPATIAGLWNVNDDAASQITAGFYRLLVKGQTSGSALHGAKLEWLQTPKATDALYLPYYWDSLILMGTDAPVEVSSYDTHVLVFSIAYCVIVLLMVVMLRKMRSGKPHTIFLE